MKHLHLHAKHRQESLNICWTMLKSKFWVLWTTSWSLCLPLYHCENNTVPCKSKQCCGGYPESSRCQEGKQSNKTVRIQLLWRHSSWGLTFWFPYREKFAWKTFYQRLFATWSELIPSNIVNHCARFIHLVVHSFIVSFMLVEYLWIVSCFLYMLSFNRSVICSFHCY